MKKITRAQSVTGLAAMAVALTPFVSALPSVAGSAGDTLQASRFEVTAGGVGTAPASRCTVMDVAAPGSPAADRIPVKQVVPLTCT
jgi:hypothetical protein